MDLPADPPADLTSPFDETISVLDLGVSDLGVSDTGFPDLGMSDLGVSDLGVSDSTTSPPDFNIPDDPVFNIPDPVFNIPEPDVNLTVDPDVNVTVEEPDINVTVDPDVNVTVEEPDVNVTVEEPDINVTVEEPDINVTVEEPDINVTVEEPVVNVTVEEPDINVTVEESVVNVTVEESDVNVTVEEPDVNVTVELESSLPPRPLLSPFNENELPSSEDFSKYKNICFISSIVEDSCHFSQYVNDDTYPVVYTRRGDRDHLRTSLLSQFTAIDRISFVFHGPSSSASAASFTTTRFIHDEMFFTIDDETSSGNNVIAGENHVFIQDLCTALRVKNVDFLGCNLLQSIEWKNYFALFQNVVVGASIDDTGNVKYGGDWVMESTMEDIRDIYLDKNSIDDFTGLLATYTVNVNGSNLTYTYTLDANNNVTITAITAWTQALNIPSIINGKPVKTIASLSSASITSLTVPVGVTSIGAYAIERCDSLVTVSLPEGLTIIGVGAFSFCSLLTTINLPSTLTAIGGSSMNGTDKGVFESCNLLASVIPQGVTSISSRAFLRCKLLTSVSIPQGVTSIDNRAFFECGRLSTINLPDGLISIGVYAFYDCSSVRHVVIPSSVAAIDDNAFGYNILDAIYFCGNSIPVLGITLPPFRSTRKASPINTYYLSTVTNTTALSDPSLNPLPKTPDAMHTQMVTNAIPLYNIYNGGFLTREFIKLRYTTDQLITAGIFFSFAELAPLNTYYNTFYTVSAASPTIMTRTIYDNVGALVDTIDISFGGQTISDTLTLMNSGGTNPFTIGLVDLSRNKIKMDLAYCNVFTKALTTLQKTKLMAYVNTTFKEPYTIYTARYKVTAIGGMVSLINSSGVSVQSIVISSGSTYVFDLSDTSNTGSVFKLSSTSGSLTEITSGVTRYNTPGTLNAYMAVTPVTSFEAYLV